MTEDVKIAENRKEGVIKTAMKLFGVNGYKKTSIADIAKEAKISKAMIFHYFETKNRLYKVVMDRCLETILRAFEEAKDELYDPKNSDFFDRIVLTSKIKLNAIREHPDIFSFIYSMYNENDQEIRPAICEYMAKSDPLRESFALKDDSCEKFKDGVDAKKVMKMLVWMTEGYIGELPDISHQSFDDVMQFFFECIDTLKKNFYKEEYL